MSFDFREPDNTGVERVFIYTTKSLDYGFETLKVEAINNTIEVKIWYTADGYTQLIESKKFKMKEVQYNEINLESFIKIHFEDLEKYLRRFFRFTEAIIINPMTMKTIVL